MRRNHVRVGYDSLNRDVFLKVLFGSELEVITYLLQLQSAGRDPRDHTIPFLKLIETPKCTFLVTPRWGFISPPFYALEEPIEFARQCLEGLTFLHEHRIAHRDISPFNIVMSYHGKLTEHPDGVRPLRSLFDVKYAFIDYGLSRKFDRNTGLEDARMSDASGTAHFCAPEIFKSAPYNPFRADVYSLGVLLSEELEVAERHKSQVLRLLKKHSPAFLGILERMCKKDPRKRPTAVEALEDVVMIHQKTGEDVLRLSEQPELGDFDYEAWIESNSQAHEIVAAKIIEPKQEKGATCLCQ
ncbi:kinase-like protein [Auricularia subglabra TFB-10046 SS5]|nr:kinase-like protein [Auricularia subglabra TFB-10046 SS5]